MIVGRDARHGSAVFATATAEVLAAEGFSVLLLPSPVPTPVVAFAVRHTGAAAGIQITASHNPAAYNGYKVYLDGGIQIVSPTDREIETAMAAAPFADQIVRKPVEPTDAGLVERYIERAATVRRSAGSVRIALTPLHGVGGAVAVETLHRAGFAQVHTVGAQFAPDPDFPTVAFPNPEEPGATDALLTLAADTHADVAIALDPDADRCAVGIPLGISGAERWRMLSGDETGWLLGDYILSHGLAKILPKPGWWPARWCRRGCWRRSPRTTAQPTSRRSPASSGSRAPTRINPARWCTPTRKRSVTASTPPLCATRTASAPRSWCAIWWRRCTSGAVRCPSCSTSSPAGTACTKSRRCRAGSPTPTRPPP